MNIEKQIQRQIETTRKSLNKTTLGEEDTQRVRTLESMVSQVAELEVDKDKTLMDRFEVALEALDDSVGLEVEEVSQ